MTDDEKATAIALVRAHVMTGEEYLSWVPPYVKIRWSHDPVRCLAERVGGHYRRRPHCKRAIDALACVCKQPVFADPGPYEPLVGRNRRR